MKLTFALANAELDASIAAWNAKLRWDYVRPITAVRTRMKGKLVLAWAGPGKGTRLIRGETWRPYQAETFPTPPFPEYVSGHSTFSSAGARVLQRFTGSDLFGARVTVRARLVLRGAGDHPAAADAAAVGDLLRRRWTRPAGPAGCGGIHFPDADLHGRTLGSSVGQNAWDKAQSYFAGTG